MWILKILSNEEKIPECFISFIKNMVVYGLRLQNFFYQCN
jgi:hypothetical protein